MIPRLILSLKKFLSISESGLTTDAFSGMYARTITQIRFGDPLIRPEESGGTTPEGVAPFDLNDSQVGGRNSIGCL